MRFLEEIYQRFSTSPIGPEEKVRQTLFEFLKAHLNPRFLEILLENRHRDIVIRRRQDNTDIFIIELKREGFFIYRNADVYNQLRGYLRRKYPPHHGALFNLDDLILLFHPSREQYPLGRRLDNIEKLFVAIHDAANEETVPINNARRR